MAARDERRSCIQVIPGVRSIGLTRVRSYLVDGASLSLVDCGYAGSAAQIDRALSAAGLWIGDVARVICTHGHPDHAGAARELAQGGAEILIHPADAENLRTTAADVLRRPSRGRFFSALTPEPPVVTPLHDGEILPELGGLEVIHTPGHTPGSVCLYGARDRILFVGDVLGYRFGRLSYASRLYSDDYRLARRSMRRLAALDVAVIAFGHYPPLRTGANEAIAHLAGQTTAPR